MSMWFKDENQIEILQGYLPVGRIFKKAYSPFSTFYNIIRWQASSFSWLVEKFNDTFKGMYLCSDKTLIDKWKSDYNIPNGIFYESKDENKKDIFALRYLMRGNTEWNFRAVANLYGVDVVILPGVDDAGHEAGNSMIVTFVGIAVRRIPHKLPHVLGDGNKANKIMEMYAMMKQAQCHITYRGVLPSDPKPKPRIIFCDGLI